MNALSMSASWYVVIGRFSTSNVKICVQTTPLHRGHIVRGDGAWCSLAPCFCNGVGANTSGLNTTLELMNSQYVCTAKMVSPSSPSHHTVHNLRQMLCVFQLFISEADLEFERGGVRKDVFHFVEIYLYEKG